MLSANNPDVVLGAYEWTPSKEMIYSKQHKACPDSKLWPQRLSLSNCGDPLRVDLRPFSHPPATLTDRKNSLA